MDGRWVVRGFSGWFYGWIYACFFTITLRVLQGAVGCFSGLFLLVFVYIQVAAISISIPGKARKKMVAVLLPVYISCNPFFMVDPVLMSDEVLLSVCVRYGEETRKWRNKFLGMLPEVNRRRLYEREGCSSVVEFAKKVGGVSEEQVRTVIRVKEAFAETPRLQELLTSGTVSVNKLARVISVVTPENEAFLVNQVQMLSQGSLEVLVRDIKHDKVSLRTQNAALLNIPETMQVSITVDQDVAEKLEELRKKGIDVNQELRDFLEQRKQEIEQEKDQIAHELATQDKPQTRYIPARTKKVIQKEHGNICSRTGCNKPAVDIHHQKRWGVDPTNDPHYLSPLCEEHHEIAHTMDVKYQEKKRRR